MEETIKLTFLSIGPMSTVIQCGDVRTINIYAAWFHVNRQVHLQNSRPYSYPSYAKFLCKCRIDFICRIYLSCFDGINTLLEFCIKLFSGHCTNS